jgi:transposase-like protein
MPVTLLCPRLSCRAILRVPDSVRGQRMRCSECGMAFVVPQHSKSPAQRPKAAEQKAPT